MTRQSSHVRQCAFSFVVALASVVATAAHAQRQPQPHLLPTLGGVLGIARDVNDSRVIVGDSTLTNNSGPGHPNVDPTHATLWSRGVAYDLGTLLGGSGASSAAAINNRSQVVGRSGTASGWDHAFLWDRGHMTELPFVDDNFTTEALDINDQGQIVGYSDQYAVLWERGQLEILDAPADARSRAVAINNRGQIAGYTTGGESMAVLWERGVLRELGVLSGGTFSVASGINDRGQVVGRGDAADRSIHAFIWEDGEITDLGPLGPGGQSEAHAINNKSVSVGQGQAEGGGQVEAALWRRDGTVVRIGPSGVVSTALSINNANDIVGTVVGTIGVDAAIWY